VLKAAAPPFKEKPLRLRKGRGRSLAVPAGSRLWRRGNGPSGDAGRAQKLRGIFEEALTEKRHHALRRAIARLEEASAKSAQAGSSALRLKRRRSLRRKEASGDTPGRFGGGSRGGLLQSEI